MKSHNLDYHFQKRANDALKSNRVGEAISILHKAIERKSLVPELLENYYRSLYLLTKRNSKAIEAAKELYKLLIKNPTSQVLQDFLMYENRAHIESSSGPLLSIIVPVHNSAKYLQKCLASILNQKFKDFELIIVNDGSIDDSENIINSFRSEDNRIRVINNVKASGNPGTPRNQALEISRGKYVGFVDSDDWIDENYYEGLMEEAISSYSDIVFASGFHNHMPNGDVQLRHYNHDEFSDPDSESYKYHDSFMIWDKVFSSRLLKAFDIKLGETKAAVDVPFIFKAYFYAFKVSFLSDHTGYNYRRESTSSVTLSQRMNSDCEFELIAYENVWKWANSADVTTHYKGVIERKMIGSLLYTLKIMPKKYFMSFCDKARQLLLGVNESSFRDFCIKQRKWWLYKEFQAVKYSTNDDAFVFFDQKRKEHKEAEYRRLATPSFNIEGSRKGIMFFPSWIRSNPYQKLFYEAVANEYGHRIAGYSPKALSRRLLKDSIDKYEYIHLHWLHVFIAPSEKDGDRELVETLKYAKELGYKIIYTAHNIISHESKDRRLELLQRKRVLELVDYCIAHGQVAKDRLMRELQVSSKKIYTMLHGTYDGAYTNLISKEKSRETLGLLKGDFVFLFFGNIRGYKGVRPLIEAYEQVHSRNTQLVIAGRVLDEEAFDYITSKQRSLNIKFYPGFVDDSDIQLYFNAADCCVLPYQRVLTSGAAMLSMTFGCPVLAPNEGVLPEVVNLNRGWLFKNYNEMTMKMTGLVKGRLRLRNNSLCISKNDIEDLTWLKQVKSLSFLRK